VGCEFHVGPLQTAPQGEGVAGQQGQPSGEVWIYTSIYQSVIEELGPLLEEELPGVKVQWYRAGSEKVATRLSTELRAGGTQADLVLISDPFWYARLKQEGRLSPHVSVDMLGLPRDYLDTEGYYATCRVSTMVIAYHPEMISQEEVPRTFKALAEPRYKDKVTLGDPLASGTHFTTTAFLSRRYGWSFYETLRQQGALASGGNSSVLRRVEGREYPIGVVLLENVLANQAKNSPVRYVLPEDGVITIPGYASLLSGSDNPRAAAAVYDVIMSRRGQEAMARGKMHSANPAVAPPKGAPGFEEMIKDGGFVWSPELIEQVQQQSSQIKTRFDEIMNR
jgi:iron(III) transport system substrate-binding protein